MKTKTWRMLPVFLAIVLLLGSCAEKPSDRTVEWEEYDEARLDDYVELDRFTGLTVTRSDGDTSKGEAVWQTVVAGARILSYPQAQKDYYVEQVRAKYRYLEEKVSDEVIQAEAEQLVKEDLVYRYIVREAEIALTETEKETLFDRYVEKYVETYGYGKDYVEKNMRDLIYESMLYDKTMEYLILNNTFTQ